MAPAQSPGSGGNLHTIGGESSQSRRNCRALKHVFWKHSNQTMSLFFAHVLRKTVVQNEWTMIFKLT